MSDDVAALLATTRKKAHQKFEMHRKIKYVSKVYSLFDLRKVRKIFIPKLLKKTCLNIGIYVKLEAKVEFLLVLDFQLI